MHALPTADAVAMTLSKFLRRKVHVTALSHAEHLSIVGLYRSTGAHDVAISESNVAFAAYSSAAFALIPAPMAQESVSAGHLDEALQDIFAEVLNVLSRLFADTDGMRITLTSTVFPPASMPAQTIASAMRFEVSIDGYGTGHLGLGLLEAA